MPGRTSWKRRIPLWLFAAGLLVTGTALLAAYVWHSRRVANPIVDLSLLAILTFGLSMVGALLFRLGIGDGRPAIDG